MPHGVTTVKLALIVAVLTFILSVLILYRLAVGMAGAPPPLAAGNVLHRAGRKIRAAVSGGWVLRLVQSPDGNASLSAFQVLFWTIVVVVSTAYVMTLSGNLINITSGTLTLLGIAGAAGLLASFTNAPAAPAQAVQPAPPPPANPPPAPLPAQVVVPQWRDFVMNKDGTAPDITRIQMLLFTVVGGGFVLLQVLNYYVIPDIPAGYQILIGISNGVYVGSKLTPKP